MAKPKTISHLSLSAIMQIMFGTGATNGWAYECIA